MKQLQGGTTTELKDLPVDPLTVLTAKEADYAGNVLGVARALERAPGGGDLLKHASV